MMLKHGRVAGTAVVVVMACAQACVGDDPVAETPRPDGGSSSSGSVADDGGSSGISSSSSGDAASETLDADASDVCDESLTGTLVRLEGFSFNGTINDVAATSDGGEVMVGNFRDMTAFGDAGIPAGDLYESAFVVKRNAEGGVVWQKSFGGADQDRFTRVATDDAGNIYVAGQFGSSSFTLGSLQVSNDLSGPGVVAKLAASDGQVLWATSYSSGSFDKGCNGIAWRNQRLVVACSLGASQQYVDSNGTTRTLAGDVSSLAVYGLDPSTGRSRWARGLRSTSTDQPQYKGVSLNQLELDDAGQVLLSGTFSGVSVSDLDQAVSASQVGDKNNGFVYVLTPSGAPDWVKGFGLSNTASNAGIYATKASFVQGGILLFSNFMNGTLDLGNGPRATVGGNDVVVALLANKAGAPAWSKYFAGVDDEEIAGLVADDCGRPVLALKAESELHYDGTPLPAPQAGGFVALTLKLDPATGALSWVHGVSPGNNDDSTGLNVQSLRTLRGRTLMVGNYRGLINFGGSFDVLEPGGAFLAGYAR